MEDSERNMAPKSMTERQLASKYTPIIPSGNDNDRPKLPLPGLGEYICLKASLHSLNRNSVFGKMKTCILYLQNIQNLA